MLRSLEIRNYRNLRHLTIEKLGRVNLLMGKNNTGKTSVLEAVAIYASSRNELPTIKFLLQRRGEFYINNFRGSSMSERGASATENNIASFSALYTDYSPSYFDYEGINPGIYIGEQQKSSDLEQSSLLINFRKAYRTIRSDESGRQISEYIVAENEEETEQRELRYEIKFRRNYLRETTYSLSNELVFIDTARRIANSPAQFQYVDSKNQTFQSVESLYSKIALSQKEDDVVSALKVIESRTERFSLVENGKPIIRLSNDKIRSLSSMGEGVSRVFSIILSMVNCEGTYLLIDEFENGLHYSVQKKLWEIIFHLAEQLNIQVFVTTHSSDTIHSFTSVLANQNNPDEIGKAIRLQLHNDNIRAINYSPEELETAVEYNIEVR